MIYGERIRFRAPEREDLPTYVRWLNDPEVRAGISMYLPMSMAREDKWFTNMLERPLDEQLMSIEIQEDDSWKLIGNLGFFHIDPHAHSAEIGIMIGEKAYWNQGYGTEAMQLLLQHGFNTLNLNRIYLQVYENNPRAIRCYEKSGYLNEGRMRQAHYSEGKFHDVILMGVLRSEWEN